MKKVIMGLGVVSLFIGGAVFAKAIVEQKFYQVDNINLHDPDWKGTSGNWGVVDKTFDEDTGVVCYVYVNKGISCLKNN